MDEILKTPIVDGPVPWIIYGLAVVLVVALLVRRWTGRGILVAGIAALAGAVLASGIWLIANATGAFGDPLPAAVLWWSMATLAAIGLAIASFRKATWWRAIVAAVSILVFASAGVIGVNAFYGLNPTLGSLFGTVTGTPIAVPTTTATGAPPARPIYETWKPPADMPAKGQVGTVSIPNTASGFKARTGSVYLPPAAQVKDAPALPVIIFMMGFPGNPDPSYIGAVLDEYAAKNNGLAPIAVVADQISTGDDPACADSRAYGNAETYITKDVVNWVKANLNVIDDPRWWVVGGYSNGGGCAIKYAATYPELWKNILDISGEPFAGSEDPDTVTTQVYGGDAKAFEASKTLNILAANTGKYAGMTAVFTAGALDPPYIAAAKTVSAAAQDAGMTVVDYTVPGADHSVSALNGGLEYGIGAMYPVLGLSAG